MKHLASKEKPKDEGLYLWWFEDSDEPSYVLAKVKNIKGNLMVHFDLDVCSERASFCLSLDNVADRLWLKVY